MLHRIQSRRCSAYFWVFVAYGCLVSLLLSAIADAQESAQEKSGGTEQAVENAGGAIVDEDVASQIRMATAGLSQRQKFSLEYKFQPGQTLVYRVQDTFTQKTGMGGVFKTVSSRTQSVKRYQVKSVDAKSVFSLVQILDSTRSWTRNDDEAPVEFDSESGDQPPVGYETIARMIGAPQILFRFTPQGKMVERRSYFSDWDLGTGGAFVPFPDAPIPVGFEWHVPDEVRAKDEDGRPHRIRLRNVYTLASVQDGLARIDCRTEVLTPTTPKLKSQFLQHLISGYRVFDLRRGCFVKASIDWNETVQGFKTSDSLLEYLRHYEEELVEEPERQVATHGGVVDGSKPPEMRTSSDPPVFRLK